MLNPQLLFDLLGMTSIPDLSSKDNQYRQAGIVSISKETEDFSCYITHEDGIRDKNPNDPSAYLIFVFIYKTFDDNLLTNVDIRTYDVRGSVITEDVGRSINLDDYSTEEALFQLSTVEDCTITLDDIKQFKKHIDNIYDIFYNEYQEIEIRR